MRTPTLGPPLRVRTPVPQTATVLDFRDDEAVVDDERADAALPTTLQNYAAELRHLKVVENDNDNTENQGLTSAVVFSPVRVPKSQVNATGSRNGLALTPVRRSPRLNRDTEKQTLDDMLAQTEYCYQPNGLVNALR